MIVKKTSMNHFKRSERDAAVDWQEALLKPVTSVKERSAREKNIILRNMTSWKLAIIRKRDRIIGLVLEGNEVNLVVTYY